MAFMRPEIQFFTATEALEYTMDDSQRAEYDADEIAAEGSAQLEGFYSRLQAPGYLDATEWSGPFETPEAALEYLCEMFEVDENGDPIGEAE